MFHVLIDSCVWLDLGKDHSQRAFLEALEELHNQKTISFILPRIVVDEFARNKDRVVRECGRSLSSTIKRVKDVVNRFGDPKQKKTAIECLNDVDHKLPSLGEIAIDTFARVEDLFRQAVIIEITESVKLRAAQRAIDKRAPFHHEGKNSIGDAIIMEIYQDFIAANRGSRNRFAFITHNVRDFSHQGGNNKLPHDDFASCLSRIKSLYFISVADALRRFNPSLFSERTFVQEWFDEPRRLTEIIDAIEELVTNIWYSRHQVRREMIEDGRIALVDKEQFLTKDHKSRPIQRDIWEGALKSAAAVENKMGLKNLGPWDDFEWGMLNGKLSALRWVLGDEWDMLDT
jgi:hypothetical protein